MIVSMTGFGKATQILDNKKYSIEIRSLNSKSADINLRVPNAYRALELSLRNIITQQAIRGKLDVSLYVESTADETPAKLNAPIVRGYMQQLLELTPNADPVELLKMAVRMPDALKSEREELPEEEAKFILELAETALQDLMRFRKSEGNMLAEEFELRIRNIRQALADTEIFEVGRIDVAKNRIRQALEALQVEVDQSRFEQEMIYYLEKWDVTEEKVRLSNHLDYFMQTMNEPEMNGRKLGFIAQEMGREINTLGSKANQSDMQKLVVVMKDELEKVKEQILNVL